MTLRKLWLPAAAVLVAATLWVGIVFWKAARAARSAAAEVAAARIANFTTRPLDRALPAVEPIGAPAAFTDVARFANGTFVSSASALVEYDDGEPGWNCLQRYSGALRWRLSRAPTVPNCGWRPMARDCSRSMAAASARSCPPIR
jgi:hypothetical protein